MCDKAERAVVGYLQWNPDHPLRLHDCGSQFFRDLCQSIQRRKVADACRGEHWTKIAQMNSELCSGHREKGRVVGLVGSLQAFSQVRLGSLTFRDSSLVKEPELQRGTRLPTS